MATKDVVVVGTSAGGIEALRTLVGGLPKDFPASVFVVLHTSPHSPGVLGDILNRAGALPAANAADGERIQPGRIYVAPPDYHLLVEPGKVRVTRGPKENRFRPAVDPLFRSAAQVYGPRAVGVILTGGLDDGTAGLWAIKRLGGTAIVQDPNEALVPSMPLNAIQHVEIDYCLPLAEIAPLLVRLADSSLVKEGEFPVPEDLEIEINIAKEDYAMDAGVLKLGEPSSYTCPDCHGVLLQMKEANPLRFRCHTGHAYTVESLLSEINENVESSLWIAIRTLNESEQLMRHIAGHAADGENHAPAARFLKHAHEARRRSDLVMEALMSLKEMNLSELTETVEFQAG